MGMEPKPHMTFVIERNLAEALRASGAETVVVLKIVLHGEIGIGGRAKAWMVPAGREHLIMERMSELETAPEGAAAKGAKDGKSRNRNRRSS